MPPIAISAEDILALHGELTEITGGDDHIITSEVLDDVHECYRRHLAGKVFARGHTKTVKLRVVGPILRFLKSEVKKGALPNYQLEEAYLWFGEVYGLGLGEDGSEPAPGRGEEGNGDSEGEDAEGFATGVDFFVFGGRVVRPI